MSAAHDDPVKDTLPPSPLLIHVTDGWQTSIQGGAVVSGLVAAVAAQLLDFFDGKDIQPAGSKHIIIGFCYAAIILNVSVMLGSFFLVKDLRKIGYEEVNRDTQGIVSRLTRDGNYYGGDLRFIAKYGGGMVWALMLYHWIFALCLGVFLLVIAILVYVMVGSITVIKAIALVASSMAFLPLLAVVLANSLGKRRHPCNMDVSPNFQ